MCKALNSLAAIKEGGHRLEAEIACFETKLSHVEAERKSLLLELEASKGEVSSLHARESKDREDMVKDYYGSLELILVYSYGCCAFKNNIYGDLTEIPDGIPDYANQFLYNFLSTQGAPRP